MNEPFPERVQFAIARNLKIYWCQVSPAAFELRAITKVLGKGKFRSRRIYPDPYHGQFLFQRLDHIERAEELEAAIIAAGGAMESGDLHRFLQRVKRGPIYTAQTKRG